MATKAYILDQLKSLNNKDDIYEDPEAGHGLADRLLLEYIDDPEITEAYDAIKKWYA